MYPACMPGSIGWQVLIVILLVALIIFGPKRLPEMGRSLGRGMREFKESVTGDSKDDDEHRLTAPEDEASVVSPRPQRDPID